MGNYCIQEIQIEEGDESFQIPMVQNGNDNKIFSNTYKMEADESHILNLIDEIEPGFHSHFEQKKKRKNNSGSHFDTRTFDKDKDNTQKQLKPSIKQYSQYSSLQREHSNKTVRWDSQFNSLDSLKK